MRIRRQKSTHGLCLWLMVVLILSLWSCHGFVVPPSPLLHASQPNKDLVVSSTYSFQKQLPKQIQLVQSRQTRTTRLYDLLSSSSGIFGVGGPEIVVILLVGYFVLGPTELYKVTKSVGQIFQNLRGVFEEYTKTLEANMEEQLQLEEIRKAQRELNNAFTFQNPLSSSSSTTTTEATEAGLETAATAGVAALAQNSKKKKKRFRRRKKPKTTTTTTTTTEEDPMMMMSTATSNNELFPDTLGVPQQDIPQELTAPTTTTTMNDNDQLRADRMSRLESSDRSTNWFDTFDKETRERANKMTSNPLAPSSLAKEGYSLDVQQQQEQEEQEEANRRFASQMSGDWNQQILASSQSDDDTIMSNILQQLQLLEEEKQAADTRLEEEFRLRGQLEEKYYQEKRSILQQVADELQQEQEQQQAEKEEEKEEASASSEGSNSSTTTTPMA